MPKQRPTKSAASGCSAEALSGDIHIDADDTGSHDAFVKRLLQVQQDAFQACLQSAIAEINRRVDNFMRETTTSLTELRVSLQYTQTQVDELTAKQTNDNVDDLGRKLRDCEDTIARVERTVDYQENQSRRCNLRFDGIPDAENETWEQAEKNVRREMTTSLELPETQVRAMTIERAHRTGRTGSKARTIVVKFAQYKDRELVLAAAKKKRPRGIYVNEDYSQRIMARRKELLPKMMKAREEGKIAYLSFDKLVVRDRD